MYIEVPDSIFLNRWWEVAMRVVFFLLGMSYSSIFGPVLTNYTYLAPPLLLIAFAIIFGRTVAMSKKRAYEKKKAIAEIMEMELQQQRAEAIRAELAAKKAVEDELELAKKTLRQLLAQKELAANAKGTS